MCFPNWIQIHVGCVCMYIGGKKNLVIVFTHVDQLVMPTEPVHSFLHRCPHVISTSATLHQHVSGTRLLALYAESSPLIAQCMKVLSSKLSLA